MIARWPILVAAAAIAAIGAALLLSGSSDAEHVGVLSELGDSRVAAPVIEDGATRVAEEHVDRAVDPQRAERNRALLHSMLKPLFGTEITGTIALRDENGIRSVTPSGRIQLAEGLGVMTPEDDSRSDVNAIAVSDGRFTKFVHPGMRLRFKAVDLDGQRASIDGAANGIDVPADGVVALTARAQPCAVLRVRDAETRMELQDVIVQLPAPGDLGFDLPTSAPVPRDIVAHGPSPVKLIDYALPRTGVVELFVRARGHATARLSVDLDGGGERLVDLVPSGSIEARLDCPSALPGVHLRLRSDTREKPIDELEPRSDKTARFDEIKPDRYFVSAELGAWCFAPIVLAQCEVDVRGGDVAHVTLSFPALPSPRPKADHGVTVRLPTAWNDTKAVSLAFELLEPGAAEDSISRELDDAAVDGDCRVFHTLVGLCSGRHAVRVDEINWTTQIDVPPVASEIVIQVPPPGTVHVHLVNDSDGLDLRQSIVFGWRALGGFDPEQPRDPIVDLSMKGLMGSSSDYEFTAPIGPIEVDVSGDSVDSVRASLMIRPGRNEHVIRVRTSTAVRLIVKDGAATIPARELRAPQLERVDGTGAVLSQEVRGVERVVRLSAPGKWRVTLPAIAGYTVTAPVDVTVTEGSSVPVAIALGRKP